MFASDYASLCLRLCPVPSCQPPHNRLLGRVQTKEILAAEGIDWQDELSAYQPLDDYCDVSLTFI